MRKLGAFYGSLATTVVLGLAVCGMAAAGDEPAEKPPVSRGWSSWHWRRDDPPKSERRNDGQEAKVRQAAEAEKARETRRREEIARAREAFLRRGEVLDRLLIIAQDANDQELLKRVKLLSSRAQSVFEKRTGQNPEGQKAVAEVSPPRSRTTEQKLGSTSTRREEQP